MTDYFDLYRIAQTFALTQADLGAALERTFMSRNTSLPTALPLGLSLEFARNPEMIAQWRGFLKRNGIVAPELTLELVIEHIQPWLEG